MGTTGRITDVSRVYAPHSLWIPTRNLHAYQIHLLRRFVRLDRNTPQWMCCIVIWLEWWALRWILSMLPSSCSGRKRHRSLIIILIGPFFFFFGVLEIIKIASVGCSISEHNELNEAFWCQLFTSVAYCDMPTVIDVQSIALMNCIC